MLDSTEEKHFLAIKLGDIAQLVEQMTENHCVGGSIPPVATKYAPMDKLVKSSLSKGEVLSVRIRLGVPNLEIVQECVEK